MIDRADFSIASETHSVVITFRNAETFISYWVLPDAEKKNMATILGLEQVPDEGILEIMFHVETPRARILGITWPFSVYPGYPTIGQNLLRDADFARTRNLSLLFPNDEYIHGQLRNIAYAFAVCRIPKRLPGMDAEAKGLVNA